jgi:O-antigen ligase
MIAQGVILAMVVWLFKMANSMTSISTFLMGSTLLLATGFRAVTRKPVVVHVLIAAMLVVSFSVLFLGISPSALETMGRNPTLTGRTEVWGVLLSLVKNSWVGTGFESFWLGPRLEKIWDVFHWRPNEAHNGYLEVFLNLGWIGVILLVVVITTGYRTVVRAWRTNIPTASLLMAYFFVGLVFNFTESAFFRMQLPAWIFFLLAATSVPAVYYRKIRPTAQNLFQHPGALSREQETVNTVRSAEVHSVRIPL